jgi:hypothetical protein
MIQGKGQSGHIEGTFQGIVVSKYENDSFIDNKAIATWVHFHLYFQVNNGHNSVKLTFRVMKLDKDSCIVILRVSVKFQSYISN